MKYNRALALGPILLLMGSFGSVASATTITVKNSAASNSFPFGGGYAGEYQ
jgi:hypothetical protein